MEHEQSIDLLQGTMDNNDASATNELANIENVINDGNDDQNQNDNGIRNRRDPNMYMPSANINRIMRRILPPHAKISGETKDLIQECTTEFISFVTAEANDHCHRDYRKTISAEDILHALSTFGFDNYIDPLRLFLNKYRENESAGTIRQDTFARRTTDFPCALQYPPPSLTPVIQHHIPTSIIPTAPVFGNLYGEIAQFQDGLFGQAPTNPDLDHYFVGGASSSNNLDD